MNVFCGSFDVLLIAGSMAQPLGSFPPRNEPCAVLLIACLLYGEASANGVVTEREIDDTL
jgi:hypothetical protein